MTTVRCPICGQSFESEKSSAMPFCSERCRRIDLGRWLNESYGMPVERRRNPDDETGWSENGE